MNYAITSRSRFFKKSKIFLANFVLFRSYGDYSAKAVCFMHTFKQHNNIKTILHNNISLSVALNADGIHFSSNNIKLLSHTPKNFIKIASTHNEYEIELACKLGADFITFSPIFFSPNKTKPKGIKELENAVKLANSYNVKVFGLGGILTNEHINLVLNTGAVGFAAIRYFED